MDYTAKVLVWVDGGSPMVRSSKRLLHGTRRGQTRVGLMFSWETGRRAFENVIPPFSEFSPQASRRSVATRALSHFRQGLAGSLPGVCSPLGRSDRSLHMIHVFQFPPQAFRRGTRHGRGRHGDSNGVIVSPRALPIVRAANCHTKCRRGAKQNSENMTGGHGQGRCG